MHAIHASIFPFYGDGARIIYSFERPEGVLPGNISVPGGYEIPAAARISPRKV
jgi:hypothetical protein